MRAFGWFMRRLAAHALLAATAMSAAGGVPVFPATADVVATVPATPQRTESTERAVEPGDVDQPRAVAARPQSAPAAGSAAEPAAPGEPLVAQVLQHLAERMPRPDHAVRLRVANAVVTESALAGIDPLLVLAVIHVESMFDPDAVSPRGAVGLMQLRGPTMREVLEREGLPSANPFDPVAGVQAGVRYLDYLLGSFGGLDAALMAYNAGPERIRGHLRAGGVPAHLQHYPERVRTELARLRLLFGAGAPPVAAAMVVAQRD